MTFSRREKKCKLQGVSKNLYAYIMMTRILAFTFSIIANWTWLICICIKYWVTFGCVFLNYYWALDETISQVEYPVKIIPLRENSPKSVIEGRAIPLSKNLIFYLQMKSIENNLSSWYFFEQILIRGPALSNKYLFVYSSIFF